MFIDFSFIENFLNKSIYLIELSCLTFETLQQQIIEVSKKNQQGKVLIKMIDCNGRKIKTDKQLQLLEIINKSIDLCLLKIFFKIIELNDLISKHCNDYDGLIFVWCGNALVTTDNKMKEIQKPKILINIC
ncbi:hypothetical protein RFI_29160 [Reticulomyxa filosa]|uniref:Uncharacterized protein n=1 Tax=Reticulomyxa filosa TaxID=46433 RepID=X6M2S0_RETFI|nr:hypothetical protein RFI_29160 [Reticulomyxa filosa]|eukprot:ETO08229.1 hypothetical protein RFI_29160 [Reticulomyxa filosa]